MARAFRVVVSVVPIGSNVPVFFRFSMSGNDTTFENFFVKYDLCDGREGGSLT